MHLLQNVGSGSYDRSPTLTRARVSGSGGDDLLIFAGTQFVTVRHAMEAAGSTMVTTPSIVVDSTGSPVAAAVALRMSTDAREGVVMADATVHANITLPTAVKTSITNGSGISGNSSTSDGCGMYSTTGFTFTSSSVTNNTSGGNGGGIFYNTSNETANVTLSTFTANSATTGGAIYVGSSNTSNQFTMQYSRIHGNTATTGSGIVAGNGTTGGTATVTDNWCGCNGAANGTGCDLGVAAGGTFNATPYTRLSLTLSSTTPAGGSTLTANRRSGARFRRDSLQRGQFSCLRGRRGERVDRSGE